jgi:hypothetical protein
MEIIINLLKYKNMEKHTSKKTSEQLKEWGCDLETEGYYKYFCLNGNYRWELFSKNHDIDYREDYPKKYIIKSYDLLWDVCVRYRFEFFGKERIYEECGSEMMNEEIIRSEFVGISKAKLNSKNIFRLLQDNKKEEAEKYLLANTIFNPKNK